MLTLNNLKRTPNSRKKRKRLGRGNASGHGTYATRGMKGQRARTGGRHGLIKFGLKNMMQRLPKQKGFKSYKPDFEIVNLEDLDKLYANEAVINPKQLMLKDLVKGERRIKILGNKVTKKFKISAQAFSKNAKSAIIKAGGEVKILKLK
jgi:large subunit ribosomal protein L15